MSDEPTTTREPKRRKRSFVVRAIIYSLLLLFVVFVTSWAVLIEAPVHFLIGWFFHARETLPPLAEKWRALIMPLACLVLAGFLMHRFIRWWLREKNSHLIWKATHTVSAMALILLGAGAAIAMSGIAHQLAWLPGEPLIKDGSRSNKARLAKTTNNARQIMLALDQFHNDRGHYPISFEEIQKGSDLSPKDFQVETSPSKLSEPFILLKPGGTRSLGTADPVILSPVLPIENRVLVGYSDLSVRALRARDFEQILEISSLIQRPSQSADE